jgi:hypothetical protein
MCTTGKFFSGGVFMRGPQTSAYKRQIDKSQRTTVPAHSKVFAGLTG